MPKLFLSMDPLHLDQLFGDSPTLTQTRAAEDIDMELDLGRYTLGK